MPTRLAFDLDSSDENLVAMAGTRCLLALRAGPEFSILEKLDDDDWRAFQVAVAFLSTLGTARGLLDSAIDNYNELADALNRFHLSGEQCCDDRIRVEFDRLINRRLANFLSAMRLFIDHLEYRLKKTYGRASVEATSFKSQVATIFDTVLAYRFSYKLRNYCQHFGSSVVVGHNSSVAEGTSVDVRYVPTTEFHTDLLLEVGGDCWGPVRRDLRSLPRVVDVASVLKDIPDALFAAWGAFLRVQEANLSMIRKVVDRTLTDHEDVSGVIVVGEWVSEDGAIVLSYQVPAVQALWRAEQDLAATAG